MITARLMRLVGILAVLGAVAVLALEVHWSMSVRHQVRTAAAAAAAAGAREMHRSHDSLAARGAAESAAVARGVAFIAFTLEPNGDVRVTVSDDARSYVLRRISVTRPLTEATSTATARQQ
jgi:hypothetical protein